MSNKLYEESKVFVDTVLNKDFAGATKAFNHIMANVKGDKLNEMKLDMCQSILLDGEVPVEAAEPEADPAE